MGKDLSFAQVRPTYSLTVLTNCIVNYVWIYALLVFSELFGLIGELIKKEGRTHQEEQYNDMFIGHNTTLIITDK